MNTPFTKVTVPVDGSPTAQRGVNYALELGRGGATLHFCSVVDAATAALGSTLGSPLDPGAIIEASEADARRACGDGVALAKLGSIVADGKVLFGAVAPAVAGYAGDIRSDAIVIGTHARHGFARAVYGSVAEGLLAMSEVPVIVTHADDVSPTDGPITIAIDGSPASRAALALGIELARASQASIAIETVTGDEREDWQDAAGVLSDAAEAARTAGVDFELVTVAGRPAETIVDGAERRGSSAIVVGTAGRSAAARLIHGSVAALVLERARVPVIVVSQRCRVWLDRGAATQPRA